MSEKELNNKARFTVLTPMVLLVVGLLLFSSCASNKCQFKKSHKRTFCPAYASEENKVMTQEEYFASLDCNNCDEID